MPTITETQFDKLVSIGREFEKLLSQVMGPMRISQAGAFRSYGRHTINRWCREGKLHPTKQGNRIYYRNEELMNAAKTNQL